jgi:hypothetical protein
VARRRLAALGAGRHLCAREVGPHVAARGRERDPLVAKRVVVGTCEDRGDHGALLLGRGAGCSLRGEAERDADLAQTFEHARGRLVRDCNVEHAPGVAYDRRDAVIERLHEAIDRGAEALAHGRQARLDLGEPLREARIRAVPERRAERVGLALERVNLSHVEAHRQRALGKALRRQIAERREDGAHELVAVAPQTGGGQLALGELGGAAQIVHSPPCDAVTDACVRAIRARGRDLEADLCGVSRR